MRFPNSTRGVDEFVLWFPRQDGMFLIRMVRMNVGVVVASGVVNTLWNRYQQRLSLKERDPLTNNVRSLTGWSVELEKGGTDTTARSRVHSASDHSP